MDETPPTEPEPTVGQPGADPAPGSDRPGPRRLTRSSSDRMLAGVAGGLAEYFSVDPVIVRIAFAISVFFGGLGAFVYVALALFVPERNAGGTLEPAAIERSRGLAIGAGIGLVLIILSWGVFDGPGWGPGWIFSPLILIAALIAIAVMIMRRDGGGGRRGGVLGAILLGILALCALCVLAFAAAWAGATGHGSAVAAAVLGIGVLLVVAAFAGGARWLIVPALALAIPLGLVSAADISFGEGIGEREYLPLTEASVPAGGYEHGIGRLEVDLRELDWERDTVIPLELDVGIGEAVVAVPPEVCVTTDFETRAGNVTFAGDDQGGIDVESQQNLGATATPRLELTGEVDLGALRVVNDPDATLEHDRDRRGWGGDPADDAESRAAMILACEGGAASEPEPGDRPADRAGGE